MLDVGYVPTRHIRPRPSGIVHGFTLIELLVVIGIIVLLIAVGLPATTAMIKSAEEKGAISTIDSAVAAARAFATRPRVVQGGEYMGAAALFAPDNSIRIIRHSSYVNGRPEFKDVSDAQPIELPDIMGVVGMARTNSSSDVRLTPMAMAVTSPPRQGAFAVRFDRHGVLITSGYSSGHLYYDVDDSGGINGGSGNTDESLPCVVAVVAYNRELLRGAEGSDLATEDTGSSAEGSWILQNGVPMLFNRYSGARVKEQP